MLAAGAAVVLDGAVAHAVPAFARRENAPCQMCHFRLPELNQDAHAYILRGLREEPGLAVEPQPLGEAKRLQWADYLTIMGHHMFIARSDARSEFDAGVIDIWAGGPLNDHWSGLTNPSFDIEEGGSEVEAAYGEFITHWAERFGSVRFGQTLPIAILFNQGGPSMTLSTPLVLDTPGDTGSGWTPGTMMRGVEVGKVDLSRWNVFLGAGQPDLEGVADEDKHTDLYASAEYLLSPEGNSLTAYGYSGKASLAPGDTRRRFDRLGAFANYYAPDTKVVAGYLQGSDDAADGRSLDNSGYFLLVERLLSEQLAAYARYDRFRRDLDAGGSETIKGPAVGLSWWAETQVRLTAEAQFLDTSDGPNDRTFMMEFLWAF